MIRYAANRGLLLWVCHDCGATVLTEKEAYAFYQRARTTGRWRAILRSAGWRREKVPGGRWGRRRGDWRPTDAGLEVCHRSSCRGARHEPEYAAWFDS